MPLVSIVVPSFNSAPFIEKTAASVFAQTCGDIELVIVDDGSTDSSPAVCDALAQNRNVTVLHTPNSGQSIARWKGVCASKGEWIMFLDADDTLRPEAVETLIRHIDGPYDIIMGEYRKDAPSIPSVIPYEEYLAAMVGNQGYLYTSPWGRLFRRSLLSREAFPEVRLGEDRLMNIFLAVRSSKSVAYESKVIYNYEYNGNSVSHRNKLEMSVLAEDRRLTLSMLPDNLRGSLMKDEAENELTLFELWLHSRPGHKIEPEYFHVMLEDFDRAGIAMPSWMQRIVASENSFLANRLNYWYKSILKK